MGIWCLNTNNTKRLLLRMRVNLMKKRKKKWPKNFLAKKPKIEIKKKKVFAKARPEIFSNLFTFNKNTPLQKKLHSILFGNWYHDSKNHKDLHHHACFFSLLR